METDKFKKLNLQIHETWIEKLIREGTPDFVIGTSYLIETYRSTELQAVVNFGCTKVYKHFDKNGHIIENSCAFPDFVLLDRQHLELLSKTVEDLLDGKKIINPMNYKNGWYIECFGKFWHSEKITGLSKEEHEKNVTEAYESIGCHVLILWEDEIEHFWEESVRPKLNRFIGDFISSHDVRDIELPNAENGLSSECLKALCCPRSYRELSKECKDELCHKIVDSITRHEPYRYSSILWSDRSYLEKKKEDSWRYGFKQCFSGTSGEILRRHFMREQFSRRSIGCRSILNVWNDQELMRKAVDASLMSHDAPQDAGSILDRALRSSNAPRQWSHWKMIYRLKDMVEPGDTLLDVLPETGSCLLTAYVLNLRYVGVSDYHEDIGRLAKFIGFHDLRMCSSFEDVEEQVDAMIVSSPMWEDMDMSLSVQKGIDCLKEGGVLIMDETSDIDLDGLRDIRMEIFREKKSEKSVLIGRKELGHNASDGFIRCRLCGRPMRTLVYHLPKDHGTTVEDYKTRFENCGVVCADYSASLSSSVYELHRARHG